MSNQVADSAVAVEEENTYETYLKNYPFEKQHKLFEESFMFAQNNLEEVIEECRNKRLWIDASEAFSILSFLSYYIRHEETPDKTDYAYAMARPWGKAKTWEPQGWMQALVKIVSLTAGYLCSHDKNFGLMLIADLHRLRKYMKICRESTKYEVVSFWKQENTGNILSPFFMIIRTKSVKPVLGLMTPGTKVKLNDRVTKNDYPWPEVLTIDHLIKNGTDSFVLVAKEKRHDPCCDKEGETSPAVVNISHVTEIVQHVPGKLKFKQDRSYDTFISEGNKHRNRYKFWSWQIVIGILAKRQFDPSQHVAVNPLIGIERFEMSDKIEAYSCKKKKLKKFVKQNFNKMLCSKKKELRAEQAFHDSMDYDY